MTSPDNYAVRVEHSPCRPIAVVRRRASRPQVGRVVQEACGIVFSELRARGVAGAGRHIAIYWDDAINLDVGVELDSPLAGEGEVVGATTPAGEVATTVHFGSYGRLGAAHTAIHQWCAANGRALAGPNWEIYGHWQEAWNDAPSQIRTDVCYLLVAERAVDGRNPANDFSDETA